MRLGKDKHAILSLFFLLFTVLAIGQAGRSYKYQFNGNLQKSNVSISDNLINVNYSLSDFNVESITNDNGSFFRVYIPGHIQSTDPGKPELPVFSRIISIPEGSSYKVKITEVKTSRINPSAKKIRGILYPAQEGQTKNTQQRKPEFKIDKAIYASRGIIASDTVNIENLGIVRGKNLSTLSISPVRYNPRSNVLELITSMKIEIIFSTSSGISTKSLYSESPLFNQSLAKTVINFNPEEVVPGFSDQPVRLIILTDTAFRKDLEPLIKWKTQKGFKVETLYRGASLAGSTYTQLKDTLTKIYNSSTDTNLPPEYLLIVGNIDKIPYYGSGNVSDMYYGEFDGNGDYIPEMYIGRLPVADTNELKSVVKKIVQYEKFEFADTNKFYSSAIASAGYDGGYANTMNGQVNYAVSNYLTPENNINEHHFYYSSSMNLAANRDSIFKLINKGTSFINYTGHGDAYSWLHLGIGMDTAKFKNLNMYPFVVSNACRTAQFSINSSFGNRMVVTKDKGAIGFIGCSNDSYWDEDYYWAVGIGSITANPTYDASGMGFYDRLFHTHGEAPSDWYYTMGQITYAGNMAVSASTSSRKKYYWETYNLVGDPSVIPIIGKPDTFNISLPDTLPNGITSLSLSIPQFAYAAVSHFDTLWDASFANVSGSVTLDMPGLSNDSCMIVISGQNKIPLIKTIYFAEVNKEYINLTSTTINDSQGNGNGVADFGETFFLSLKVNNLGLTAAEDLYAKISSVSEWITIDNDSVFIGTLPALSEVVIPDKLEITISGSVPDNGIITLALVLKDQKTEKHFTIDICAHAPDLEIISCIMDDTVLGNGNLIADPGETYSLIFKVRNQGSSDISGQFNIFCTEEGFTILDPSVKSGVLKFGEITDIPMTVKLAETVAAGTFINVSSILDCNPYIISKEFSFRAGRIRESFEASSFNIFPWINISPVPWIFSGTNAYDGGVSARSGSISHGGTSTLMIKTTYPEADSIKFYYKVSSELNYDTLIFRLNGKRIFKKSGEVPWTKIAVPVAAGLNKMEWIYHKDGSVSQGSDCAWIDMIDFAGAGSVNYIQKDLVVARIVTPIQKDKLGKETITVKLLNTGKDIINNFNLAYKINDYSPVSQLFQNTITPFGDSVTVSFETRADLSKYGIYSIKTYGFDNQDDYLANDTLKIDLENTEINETLSLFPNPFSDHFSIFYNSNISDKLDISIINNTGATLFNTQRTIVSGKNEIVITGLKLAPSVYYLKIRGVSINRTIPVLKIN